MDPIAKFSPLFFKHSYTQAAAAYPRTLAYYNAEYGAKCDSNPLCFKKGITLAPYVSIGGAGIFGKSFEKQNDLLLNIRASGYFQNDKDFYMGFKVWSLGIGPDLQLDLSPERRAGSAGLAMRIVNIVNGSYGGYIGWGGISARLGAGSLDTKGKDGTFYEGIYQFLALDATFSFWGFYIGVGIRKEFWPNGNDSKGHLTPPPSTPIFPVLAAGIGFL